MGANNSIPSLTGENLGGKALAGTSGVIGGFGRSYALSAPFGEKRKKEKKREKRRERGGKRKKRKRNPESSYLVNVIDMKDAWSPQDSAQISIKTKGTPKCPLPAFLINLIAGHPSSEHLTASSM
jgi:hypothetical protein